ncbi:uncharacterized protein LOC130802927 [Amaranthus tricolor]|uniref:uncharacterized protein LOC130802927 n=1 Tax=Amaranthus tricolor TaxID=29722 RepID=UPI00258E3F87|nr:uncharacterized protein LOC130802927 [Amaranthus tricolor]
MAVNFTTSPSNKALFGYCVPKSSLPSSKDRFRFFPSSSSSSEGSQSRATATEDEPQDDAGFFTSTRAQLGLLEQLTSSSTVSSAASGYESDSNLSRLTIREQLVQLVGDRDDDFIIQLGKKNLKKVSPKFLTISQKRNIRRQAYLNEVSQRNDSVVFATIGAFVILPPVIILGIAIATGYVQLFP